MSTTERCVAHFYRYCAIYLFPFLLVAFISVYGTFFPNRFGLLGHDFSLAHPVLLDGAYWFWTNGLFTIPWFTPSFCGGQPFFADPQSTYFSLIQFLSFLFPPTKAAFLTLIMTAAMGFWSFYFLASHIFRLSPVGACIVGAMAMFNGFTPYRMVIGETGYQPFLLVGVLATALMSSKSWPPLRIWGLGNVFWAGVLMAVMLQGGLTTLMIPIGIGVLVVACLASLLNRGCGFRVFFIRGVVATVFAAALCASKLVASAQFFANFPRNAYPLPGFSSITDAIVFPFISLVVDSESVWRWSQDKISNAEWAIFPHEWAYQFGIVFLIIVFVGLVLFFSEMKKGRRSDIKLSAQSMCLIACILFCCSIPVMLLYYSPSWNTILKEIPIIQSTSFPFRWIIILIPAGAILGGLAWERIISLTSDKNVIVVGLVICCIAVVLESQLTRKDYYFSNAIQTYNPQSIDHAWNDGHIGHIPPIEKIDDVGLAVSDMSRNDALIHGASMLQCYNPAYGYRLETFPLGRLLSRKPALETSGKHLNIKNPSCLIWPKENNCDGLGEEYKIEELDKAIKFTKRLPIEFSFSKMQEAANVITFLSVIILGIGVLFSCLAWILRFLRIVKGRIV